MLFLSVIADVHRRNYIYKSLVAVTIGRSSSRCCYLNYFLLLRLERLDELCANLKSSPTLVLPRNNKGYFVVLPNLELENFVPDELQNTFRLWRLDPSQKAIFTAVDGHTNDQHEIRHFSTAEFYIFAGYKRTSRRQLRFHNYIGKQRTEAELVNIFINGDKKYRSVQALVRVPRSCIFKRVL
ncbi:MAG: hypothetical protein EXX96DRAFT_643986 [Benjaminiella poitrasii]|nr:MAG: hypothetical protein EXX96DRAFT_643986 [Benjaminiella poitrasii]